MPVRGDDRDDDLNEEAKKLRPGKVRDYGPYGQQRSPEEDMSETKKLRGREREKDRAEKARDQKNPDDKDH